MNDLESNIELLENLALKAVQKIQQADAKVRESNNRILGIVALFENAGLTEPAPAQENELNSESAPTGGLLDYALREAEGANE